MVADMGVTFWWQTFNTSICENILRIQDMALLQASNAVVLSGCNWCSLESPIIDVIMTLVTSSVVPQWQTGRPAGQGDTEQ